LWARSCRRAGTPAAGGGGRCGCLFGEVGARLDLRTGRRAMVGAGEVEKGPLWLAVGRGIGAHLGCPVWAPTDDTGQHNRRSVLAKARWRIDERVTSSGKRLKEASPSPPAGRRGTGGYGVAGAVPRAWYPAARGASPRGAGPSGRCPREGATPREGARVARMPRGGAGARRCGAACARERVRGRFLFGVPLFEHDFLQNFE
jgi:hypothetical protein